MQAPSLKGAPAYARALFDHGIRDLSDLACAGDGHVQKAILAALARAFRAPSGAKGKTAAKYVLVHALTALTSCLRGLH